MNIQEIQTRKEDQTFDCKSIQIDPKALAVPIVAFANADGGLIAIGVSDKTRNMVRVLTVFTESLKPMEFLLCLSVLTNSSRRLLCLK